ncbi:MAG: tetratricopeptide repeat protein [Chloroflexi bacterium]|nr:tetratricopeptide repeat protein [Chloroflexota bacterium]
MSEHAENFPSLGAWIRRRRKALDLTQAALADRVGCAPVTIRKLESEVTRPSRQIAERLATCLDLNLDERAVFLQVARGERGSDRLPAARLPNVSSSAHVELPIAALPRETVPSPAPLPNGSRMPLHRNPLFVGRAEDLRAVAEALHLGSTAAIGQIEIAAATGLGGIGKTQLACEFAHRYGQFFAGGVFWLSFADPAAVPAEVAACGGSEGMQLSPDFETLPLDAQVRQVLTVWTQPLPRLLIFDNCEDEALLAQWQPPHGGCRVLVTSRRHHWDPALGVQAVSLDVLSRPESLILLRSFRPDLPADDADLAAIAEALGDLPLALHMAGRFLAKYRHVLTPAQYLARLHAPTILDDRSLRDAGLSPTQHVQHVARTFEQSYAQLDVTNATDALARTLLAHAACFAPGEPLPRWLLFQTLELPEHTPQDALLSEDALRRIIDLGLLETGVAGVLRLHRLVAAFVRAVLAHDAAQVAVEATMVRVADALNEQRNPRPLLAIEPHLRFLTETAQPRADARAAGLCHALGFHLWLLGVYGEAQTYLEQAVALRQRILGRNHPDTALSINNLGYVFWTEGQYTAAQGYFEQALAIRQHVLGTDHPDTTRSLNNLAVILWEQGWYAAARGYHEQVLAIRQRVFGFDHPDTARSLNNLGLVLESQGEYAAAQGYLEQAVAIRQRVFGSEHPDTASSLYNLGNVLRASGQYAAAQGYLEQAVAIRQRVLGANHHHTVLTLDNLGVVFRAQGQYAVAQRYHEQAIAVYQQVLRPDHPHTATSFYNLGIALYCQKYYAAAQRYFEQSLAMYQRGLGSDHPNTARSLRGLGAVLRAHGDATQAWSYLEHALTIFLERLGPHHPDTEQTRQLLDDLDGGEAGIAVGC